MHQVIYNSALRLSGQTGFLPLGLFAAFMTPGCGHTSEHLPPRAVHGESAAHSAEASTVHASTLLPRHSEDEKLAVPRDEQSEWVPITGDEQVIVDKIPLLSDGVAVQSAAEAGGKAHTSRLPGQ